MAIEILKRNTVNHRNGTSTNWTQYRADTYDIALKLAQEAGVVPKTAYVFPSNMRWELMEEPHGSRTYVRIRILRSISGIEHTLVTATKSEIGHKFNVQFNDMDKDTAVYWEAGDGDTVFLNEALHAPTIERVMRAIAWKMSKVDLSTPYPLSGDDLQALQTAAIEQDEFELAGAIDRMDQLGTFKLLNEYLTSHGADYDTLRKCGLISFYPLNPLLY